MSQTIDLKTKKIIPQQDQKFDKALVLENLERNILSHWDTWGKFQQASTGRAYKAFHDLGLVNEYQLFLAPAFMGGSDGLSIFSGDSSQSMTDLWRGKIQDVVELGNDIKVTVVPEHN